MIKRKIKWILCESGLPTKRVGMVGQCRPGKLQADEQSTVLSGGLKRRMFDA